MKRFISCLFAIIVLLCSITFADAMHIDLAKTEKNVVSVGDWVLEKVENGTRWEMDEYVGPGGDVIVPWQISDIMVVSLGDHCFANNTDVTSVITSSPPWRIGEYCFIDCTSLKKVELNFMLDTIEVGAFSGTSLLKDINLQDTIVATIEPYTFLNSGIEHITLPETCVEIKHDAFAQCDNLSKVFVPNSVTSIHEDAFRASGNVVIYCYTDSYAHQYAVSKNIPFVLLDAVVPTEPKKYLLGDADMDGIITVTDATFIQRVLVNIPVSSFDEKAANVTGEGLDIVDAAFIQRYLVDIPIFYSVGEWFTYDE